MNTINYQILVATTITIYNFLDGHDFFRQMKIVLGRNKCLLNS